MSNEIIDLLPIKIDFISFKCDDSNGIKVQPNRFGIFSISNRFGRELERIQIVSLSVQCSNYFVYVSLILFSSFSFIFLVSPVSFIVNAFCNI